MERLLGLPVNITLHCSATTHKKEFTMWQTVLCCSLKQWGFRSIKLLHEDQQMGFSAYSEHSPILVKPTHCGSSGYMHWTDLPLKTQTLVSASICWTQGQSRHFHFSCSWASQSLSHSWIPKPQTALLLPLQAPFTQRASASLLCGEIILFYAWFKKSGPFPVKLSCDSLHVYWGRWKGQ